MSTTDLAWDFHRALGERGRSYLRKRGLSERTIRDARLGYVEEGRYADSISIPYLNPSGTVKSIRFRYLSPIHHKYDNLKGERIHLYNVGATTSPRIWICEGEFDALILGQLGFPAVGLPGASGFKPDWKYLFAGAEQVTILMDPDDAGVQAGKRLASILGEVAPTLRLVHLPGKDVTDLYLDNPQALKALVA